MQQKPQNLVEYFKLGATSGNLSGSKKLRKQKADSSQKARLPCSCSQMLDTPTIISNIMSRPIHYQSHGLTTALGSGQASAAKDFEMRT